MSNLNKIKMYDETGEVLTYLTQWDMNRVITIKEMEGITDLVCQFTNHFRRETLNVVAQRIDKSTIKVAVPNVLLQEPFHITLYVYESNMDTGKTGHTLQIPVIERQKPSDYEYIENIEKITADVLWQSLRELQESKVNKEEGKVLSDYNFDDSYKQKIEQAISKEQVEEMLNQHNAQLNKAIGIEVDYETQTVTRLGITKELNAGVDFNRFAMFGGRKRCMMGTNGSITSWYGDSNYVDDGSAGGSCMVYQPAFWYKVEPLKLEPITGGAGYHLRKAKYYVAEVPLDGFKLHPAFYDETGKPVNHVFLSAYEGSGFNSVTGSFLRHDEQSLNVNTDLLVSTAKSKPTSGTTQSFSRSNAEKLAKNRGAGWHIETIQTLSANQLLMMIEYATLDLQSALEKGIVDIGTTQGKNGAAYTGSTTTLGNASGNAQESISIVSAELIVKEKVLYGSEKQLGSGEPSPDNVRAIVTGGNCDNLVSNKSGTHIAGGIIFTPQPDGSIKMEGTATADTGYAFGFNVFARGYCTLSGHKAGMRLYINEYSGNTNLRDVLTYTNPSGNLSLTTGDNFRAILIVKKDTITDTTIYPMLNYGDTAQPWVPYKEGQQYATRVIVNGEDKLIPLKEPLCNEDIFETKVLVGGVAKSREKHVKKRVVFDGSELWGDYVEPTNADKVTTFYTNVADTKIGYGLSICDRFKNINLVWDGSKGEGFSDHPSNVSKYFTVSNSRVGITTGDSRATKISKFKAWLAVNPVTLIYDLATPTEYLGEPIEIPSSNGKRAIAYRGMENPWGNMAKLVNGINLFADGAMKGGKPYICKDYNFAENKTTDNYVGTGFMTANISGWISSFGYSESFDWLFLPSKTSIVEEGIKDYFYTPVNSIAEHQFMQYGGDWQSGARAGLFGYDFKKSGESNSSVNAGARLIYVPKGF
ncbi:hypothetical protein [Scatolibacter rhodanostii]|uniref:hypothetical protein n=1 Tax=Scatolibacter rhodanostii TaxID=2014781 RepID=UPI000C08D728|nr:hypothetical protein [Scatolibacter rhodanostii]